MNFVWNEEQSKSNLHKHGISFDVAMYVFLDNNRVEIYDEKHSSKSEDRYITIVMLRRFHWLPYLSL